jgi:hypothetical protein
MEARKMYEVIKHYLKKWFGKSPSEKEILFAEFSFILTELDEARTLAQLSNIRTKISAYAQAVKRIGNPTWGKNKVNILNAHWNKRYRLWKKNRGYYGTYSQNKKTD